MYVAIQSFYSSIRDFALLDATTFIIRGLRDMSSVYFISESSLCAQGLLRDQSRATMSCSYPPML